MKSLRTMVAVSEYQASLALASGFDRASKALTHLQYPEEALPGNLRPTLQLACRQKKLEFGPFQFEFGIH